MCGRYLIDEEAYSDISEILSRPGAMPGSAVPGSAVTGAAQGTSGGDALAIPYAIRDSMAATMSGAVTETVPEAYNNMFPGGPQVVTNGEVFPTNIVPVYVNGGAELIKWGFPHWKNSSVIINARAETVLEKQMFRKALLENRCVVPSSGFFEWGAGGLDKLQIGMFGSGYHENYDYTGKRRRNKTKYLLRRPDERKLYMAGFWSTFRDSGNSGGTGSGSAVSGASAASISGGQYTAFVILTTAASSSVAPIHNRMPLILSPDEKDDWLSDIGFAQYALHRPGPELSLSAQ